MGNVRRAEMASIRSRVPHRRDYSITWSQRLEEKGEMANG
jgi:hypothetical protein